MDVIQYPGDARRFDDMLSMARALGVKDLVVVGFPEGSAGAAMLQTQLKKMQATDAKQRVRIYPATFTRASGLARLPRDRIILSSPERACVEHPRVRGIIGGEGIERKDRLHERSSGMNMVIASIAARGKKVLLLDIALLATGRKEQALGRFVQNARLARKARIPVLVVSGAEGPHQMRAPQEMKDLAHWLAIPPSLVREAEALMRRDARLNG